jgi:hypothetical protein
MTPEARKIRHTLSSPRAGTSVAFAGVLVTFMLGSCTDELPEGAQTTPADSPQVESEAPADQLPLPDLMQSLERDMGAVWAGLWMEEPEAVAAAARRVAEHPPTTLVYRQAIQEELGDLFPAFVQYDQEVHETAQLLADRAETGTPIAELLELQHEVARGCVDCHTGFRSRLQPAMDRLRSDAP